MDGGAAGEVDVAQRDRWPLAAPGGVAGALEEVLALLFGVGGVVVDAEA
ncbi:MAG: hypothetical protein U5Q44_08995 [Dehalococcoidia bacterium]|nr:hypothetical protein [Dehalococcoidia bacterium]